MISAPSAFLTGAAFFAAGKSAFLTAFLPALLTAPFALWAAYQRLLASFLRARISSGVSLTLLAISRIPFF